MKIGFISMNFYPYRGGAEDITFNIASELVKLGHEIHVFSANSGNESKTEVVEGINIHRSKRYFRYKYYLDFTPGIIKDVLSYKLDILHVQSIGFIINDIAVILKKLFSNTKLVNTPHGPFMALEKYPLWQEVLKFTYRTLEYPINTLYDRVIQVNPFQWRWMTKQGFSKKRIRFIPNSIPEDVFKKSKKSNLKNKFILTYVGRIQKYKGLDQIIKVLPEAVKINPDIMFVAMGSDAGDLKRLKKLSIKLNVEKNVMFPGFISDEEKLSILDASDIFIFPSQWEAFGIVLLEAMARKNALISTKTEGGSYLIGDGVNGFLYNFNDTEGLKKSLLKLISDKKLVTKMKLINYKKSQEYKCGNIVKRFEDLYKGLYN